MLEASAYRIPVATAWASSWSRSGSSGESRGSVGVASSVVMSAVVKLVRKLSSHEFYLPRTGRFQLAPQPSSEVVGRSLRNVGDIDPGGAVLLADVAEPALLGTGDPPCRLIGREPEDQCPHVGDELGIDSGGGAANVGLRVADLTASVFALEMLESFGDSVLVDADLGLVRWAGMAGLGIGNEDLVMLLADEVRLAGDGGGGAAEAEEILVLGVDVVADVLEALPLPVHQGGVLEHPRGAVEVGGRLCPALVVGLEPSGPLTGVLAGEELGQGGYPDVGAAGASLDHWAASVRIRCSERCNLRLIGRCGV